MNEILKKLHKFYICRSIQKETIRLLTVRQPYQKRELLQVKTYWRLIIYMIKNATDGTEVSSSRVVESS